MNGSTSRLADQACSFQSLFAGEALAGTAPQANTWVFVEQPGPWGREALKDSQLAPELAESLRALDAQPGIKVLLTRHPSRTSRTAATDRYVWVSRSDGHVRELFQAQYVDQRELTATSLSGLSNGNIGSEFKQIHDRFAFVCTHSGRDACCAVLGRELIDRSIPNSPDALSHLVWECSHIGGHRFAPTALLAPINTVVGRCEASTIHDWVAAGTIRAGCIRGASWLDPQAQAAQAYILSENPELQTPDIHIELTEVGSSSYRVTAQDGRSWMVHLASVQLDLTRPDSCGGEPTMGTKFVITHCDQLLGDPNARE